MTNNTAVWLSSQEAEARAEYLRIKAQRLPWLKLRWYKFALFWKLGNIRRYYQAIRLHNEAVSNQAEDKRIYKTLAPEAKLYGRLLSHSLARIGFSHVERERGRRRFTQVVRLERCVMNEAAFYYKVFTARATATGSKSMLPYRVKAGDLVDDETLQHLSITLNRKVTAEYRPHRGLWFVVWRTKDMAGLPRVVDFHDMQKFHTEGNAELCLGVGDNRAVHMVNMATVPHALVAGETGGGKSNTVNGFICGLIRHNTPQQLKLILIDLKNGVEFRDYDEIPHLATDIITNMNGAEIALRQALAIIKQRYARMAKRARNLDEFNSKLPDEKRIPRLVIIIDELAEILLGRSKSRDEIETLLIRICQLGRAAGVHVIAATQRPQKEIVNTAISANMSLKVAHKMSRSSDSLTILGTGHAAELEDVPGRACYKKSWRVVTVQPPFITAPNLAESVAIAQQMELYDLELPDVEEANELIEDTAGAVLDYDAALVRMMKQAGGRLDIEAIKDVLSLKQWQAGKFQQDVAGEIFEYNGQHYRVNKRGKSYQIQPFDMPDDFDEPPPAEDDTEPYEPVPAPAAASNGKPPKWPGKRKGMLGRLDNNNGK
jgi:hypothetical protein